MESFESYVAEFVKTAEIYSEQCRTGSPETTRTRRDLLGIVWQLQTSLFQPTDFLQRLTLQVAQ